MFSFIFYFMFLHLSFSRSLYFSRSFSLYFSLYFSFSRYFSLYFLRVASFPSRTLIIWSFPSTFSLYSYKDWMQSSSYLFCSVMISSILYMDCLHSAMTLFNFSGSSTSRLMLDWFMFSSRALRLMPILPPFFFAILDVVVVMEEPSPISSENLDSFWELFKDSICKSPLEIALWSWKL